MTFCMETSFTLAVYSSSFLGRVKATFEAMSSGSVEEESGLDISGISQVWDGERELRSRLRNGGPFIHPLSDSKVDNQTCVQNIEVLMPLIARMTMSAERKLPGVADLRMEMQVCYEANKRKDNPEDNAAIIADSWHIRKLLSHVKAKVRRNEVSTEPLPVQESFGLV